MKYFIDTEFIEGFHKPLFGKRRHFIDLISIGIVAEDGREYYAISNEYRYKDADKWVQDNVILPMYIDRVHGDARNRWDVHNFHHAFGKSNEQIKLEILEFMGCWRDTFKWRVMSNNVPGIYAYFADYDWVAFCSLFGRMVDLPEGFPMYCIDLKQTLDEKSLLLTDERVRRPIYNLSGVCKDSPWGNESATIFNCTADEKIKLIKAHPKYPAQEKEHISIADARWDKKLYEFLQTI